MGHAKPCGPGSMLPGAVNLIEMKGTGPQRNLKIFVMNDQAVVQVDLEKIFSNI